MAIYRYISKDLEGKSHKGEIESSTELQAANLLRRKKLIVISIKEKDKEDKKIWDGILNKVSFTDVVIITRQLATMVESGLVLSEALDILIDQQESGTLKKVLIQISADVKGGIDFASSLEKHPDVFPPLYSKLIRAGQTSGKLDTILLQLANNLEKDREFQSRVKGAMIYPVVVVTMMIAVMLVMVFFVMPKLTGLYKESGIELPLPTRIMLAVAGAMTSYWWAMVAMIAGGIFAFKRYIATEAGKAVFDSFILKIPVIGKIVTKVILTSFTRTFALLISSGVSMLESIKIVSDIVGNSAYKNGLLLSYKGVERGLTFSSQLLALPWIPKIIGQMVKTGEETGKLDDIMFRLADYFESETDHSLKNATTLIEPLVLIMLGIGVGFLVISIILPIYQLTTNIK